ncbi:putative oxidoreductase [Polystyrenella longa]|uniref:Putative oxidoreductase n=1 Tax=Polystyrenella longa TaxID=2528007 RepID=A0A518CMK8_9PLAN|nr:SDR family oxidoreductase [Polystyrenella longa]QDU80458.1 putative oxidoreductase [Polystyrenella longa]
MPPKLLNKTAVVTGGSRGIGRAVVELLLQEGARVIAVSRSIDQPDGLEELASPRLITHLTDVTNPSDLARLVEFTQRRIRNVDILCPLAGRLFHADLLETSRELIEENIRINSISAWETFQKFRPILSKQAAVCFITFAPLFEQMAGLEQFAGSKALLRSYVRSLSDSGLPDQRVNAVACTPTQTTAWNAPDLLPLVKEKKWNWLTPEEVADTILFLVSEESRALRGTELVLSAPAKKSGNRVSR